MWPRIPKRYNNIVGLSMKNFNSLEKDFKIDEKRTVFRSLSKPNRYSVNIPRRHSSKALNKTVYFCNSCRKESYKATDYHYRNRIRKSISTGSPCMQTAMNNERLHSLDRNFIFGHHKQSIIFLGID